MVQLYKTSPEVKYTFYSITAIPILNYCTQNRFQNGLSVFAKCKLKLSSKSGQFSSTDMCGSFIHDLYWVDTSLILYGYYYPWNISIKSWLPTNFTTITGMAVMHSCRPYLSERRKPEPIKLNMQCLDTSLCLRTCVHSSFSS